MMRNDEPCFWEILEQRGFSNISSTWGVHYHHLLKASSSFFQPDYYLEEMSCGVECVQACPAIVMSMATGELEKHCPQRRFKPEILKSIDVLSFKINVPLLHKSIARALGINEISGENKITGAQLTYCVGKASQGADREMREHFIIYARNNNAVQRAIDAIIRHQKNKPYVLLLPTAKNVDAEIDRLLCQSGGSKIILSNTLPLQSNGKFGFGTADEVREATAVYSPENEKFKTPEGCTWENITIEFLNDDQMRVSAGKMSGFYSFYSMGFESDQKTEQKNITKAWAILVQLSRCQEPGVLYYRELGYSEKELRAYQKQKQILSGMLKKFFGLSEEPIIFKKTDWTYRCRFQIKPNKKTANSHTSQSIVEADLEMDTYSEFFDNQSPSYLD